MAQLDEVSKAIGRIESKMELLGKLDEKLDIINGRVGKTEDKVKRMDEILKTAAVQANDWTESKKKAKWIMVGSGMAGVAGGFSLSSFIKSLLGG